MQSKICHFVLINGKHWQGKAGRKDYVNRDLLIGGFPNLGIGCWCNISDSTKMEMKHCFQTMKHIRHIVGNHDFTQL